MDDVAKLEALADRVEQLEGPDREVDAEVALAIGYTQRTGEDLRPRVRNPSGLRWFSPQGEYICHMVGSPAFPPHWTASLDAAMTLGLEAFTPQQIYLQFHSAVNAWQASGFIDPFELARFITAAALRALAQEKPHE